MIPSLLLLIGFFKLAPSQSWQNSLVFSPTVSLKRSVITSARLRAISDLLLRRLVLFLTSIWTLNLTSQSTSSFFHLKNITKIKPLLSSSNSELLVHTLIFSRLDYCDSLFTWISLSLVLPSSSFSCSRNTSQRSHQPILASLHRLKVKFCIYFINNIKTLSWGPGSTLISLLCNCSPSLSLFLLEVSFC